RRTAVARRMLILGLDPGSLHTGYGLVDRQGSSLRLLEVGRISCPRDLALPARLGLLAGRLAELLARHPPDLAAVETPFHGLNARSLIVLAQARGALLATLATGGVEVREYSPAEVKSAVTGNGRADKTQVARMVKLLLAAEPAASAAWASDGTDALALALCCAQRLRMDRLTRQNS
ncbi:MAG TPA: crossover junction endodeoxyribonuclease RuvC, partial [Thermoanaerobaculia bacterium]